MRISIEFDSCWQTSFLDGDSNSPVSKKDNPRKFVATTKTRGEKNMPITKDTVMGVLCRLIGEQRKLYQARSSSNYYFSEMEDKVFFSIRNREEITHELIYLTNKSDDRCAQSNFLGVLSSDNPWFFSEEASIFWSVLYFDKQELLNFILQDKPEFSLVDCTPKALMARVSLLTNTKTVFGEVVKTKEKLLSDKTWQIEKAQKKLNEVIRKTKSNPPKTDAKITKNQERINEISEEVNKLIANYSQVERDPVIKAQDEKIKSVIKALSEHFPDCTYLSKDIVYPVSLYAAALYLQAERLLIDKNGFDFLTNKKGEIQIQGFSKRGFNGTRDWINTMTGGRKKSVGTPCIVQKQSGILDITIDVSRDDAKEIKRHIEDAGVSSFYLGKKGLAHLSQEIDTREVRQ